MYVIHVYVYVYIYIYIYIHLCISTSNCLFLSFSSTPYNSKSEHFIQWLPFSMLVRKIKVSQSSFRRCAEGPQARARAQKFGRARGPGPGSGRCAKFLARACGPLAHRREDCWGTFGVFAFIVKIPSKHDFNNINTMHISWIYTPHCMSCGHKLFTTRDHRHASCSFY